MSRSERRRRFRSCYAPLFAALVGVLAPTVRPLWAVEGPTPDDGRVGEAIAIAEITRDAPVSYAKEVRPILARNCVACHNASKAESGLNLERPDAMVAGGDSGPAIAPGRGAESLLIRVASRAEEPWMPPADNRVGAKPLLPEELGLIARWIQEGAVDDAPLAGPARLWQPLPAAVNPILAVAVAPDGQVAACGRANQVFVYNLPAGTLATRLTDPALLSSGLYRQPGVAHLDLVQSLAFSPDGDRLASGGFREVKIWRRPRNARRAEISLPGGATALSASPNGDWLAFGYANGDIRLWDSHGRRELAMLKGHAGPITALRAFAGGRLLASASQDGTLRVWKAVDGAQVGRIGFPTPLTALEMVGDDTQAAVGSADHLVRIVRLPLAPPEEWRDVTAGPRTLVSSADRRLVTSVASDGAIRLIDATSGGVVKSLPGSGAAVQAVAITPDAGRLVAAEADGQLRIWNTAELKSLGALRGGAAATTALALHPGGTRLIQGTADGKLHQWKLDTPPPTPIGPERDAAFQGASISPSGSLAYATNIDGQPGVIVTDFQSGAVVGRIPNGQQAISAVALSADGQMVAIASAAQPIKVVRASDGAEIKQIEASGQTVPVRALAFSPDGQNLVTAADRTVHYWRIADGSLLKALELSSPVSSVAISRDAGHLAGGLADGTLKVLNTSDGGEQLSLATGTGPIEAAAFSQDGQRLVCITGRHAVVVDLATKSILEAVDLGHAGGLVGFAAPDELIAASADRRLYKYALHRDFELAAAGANIVRAIYRNDGHVLFVASGDGQLRGLAPANNGQIVFDARHGAAVHDLSLSPDGRWLATAGDDRQVRLWNAENGSPAPHSALGGFSQSVLAVAFSGDNQRVIASSAKETLVFDLATGALEESFEVDPAAPVVALAAAFEPAAGFLAAAADHVVRRLRPAVTARLAGHTQPVTALAAHPQDKNLLVSAGQDASIRVWSLNNAQQLRQWDQGGPVSALAVRPDGRQAASCGGHHLVRLWNVENGQAWTGSNNQPIAEMKGDQRAQLHAANMERNRSIADAKVADRKKALQEAETLVTSSTEAVKTATANKENTAKTLSEKTEAAKAPIEARRAAEAVVAALVESQQQTTAKAVEAKAAVDKEPQNADLAKVLADAQRAVEETDKQLKDSQAKAKEAAVAAKKAEQEQVAADAAQMAAEQALTVTLAASERAVAAVPVAQEAVKKAEAQLAQARAALDAAQAAAAALDKPIRAVAYSRDGSQLAAASENQLVRLWNSETGAPIDSFAGHQAVASAVMHLPDGGLVSAGGDAILVWDTAAPWQLERTIGDGIDGSVFADRVASLAFSPDGRVLATGGGEPSRGGEIKLWNAVDGALLQTLADPHSDAVFGLSFSPESDLLASAGADRFMKVFRAEDGTLVRSFEGHSHHVLGVGWRADGKMLATCGADGVIKVWDFASGDQKLTTPALSKEITSISFVADTTRVFITAGDKTARVYNSENGGNEKTLSGATDFVQQGSVTPDGKIAVGGDQDGKLLIWSVENGQLLRQFDPPVTDATGK